jgi:histidyl-tRNA synthetase
MSLKAQMKLADKLGAAKVVMIGENELKNGEATIRDMRTKAQTTVKLDDMVKFLEGEQG